MESIVFINEMVSIKRRYEGTLGNQPNTSVKRKFLMLRGIACTTLKRPMTPKASNMPAQGNALGRQ
jgi:hypothetical protein